MTAPADIALAPDGQQVREFVETYVAQARAATTRIAKPGIVQMILVHPNDDNVTSIYRYALDDNSLAERMTREAIEASKSGHNIYVEGRTVRGGLNGKQRGTITDTVAVFALTVDSDADKGAAWTPTVPVSLSVETSPGNAHHWLFLDKAIGPRAAQRLGGRLKAAVGGDADTGVITQPYRLAGTVNYPNKKKRERGRTIAATRILEFNPETLWTLRHLARTFPRARKPAGGPDPDEATIDPETMDAIRSPVKGGRGTVLWNVVQTLREDGWTVAGIVAVLERYPDGLAQKFRGRLQREVKRAWEKIKIDDRSSKPINSEIKSAKVLQTMTFAPIKHVVPGIFIEGLTLLAGKPKGGKSWLLLDTAIAVATNGWTLGEIHCLEGDVLYCALEDSERRLQSRLRKLRQDFPERLSYCTELARLATGGLAQIRDWITVHPQARLVIIDTLAMVRETRKREETNYDADYAAILDLRKLANDSRIAIVVVHHLRKADADDAFDTVSGTLGLTGAPTTSSSQSDSAPCILPSAAGQETPARIHPNSGVKKRMAEGVGPGQAGGGPRRQNTGPQL
jgi:hypothetical protein